MKSPILCNFFLNNIKKRKGLNLNAFQLSSLKKGRHPLGARILGIIKKPLKQWCLEDRPHTERSPKRQGLQWTSLLQFSSQKRNKKKKGEDYATGNPQSHLRTSARPNRLITIWLWSYSSAFIVSPVRGSQRSLLGKVNNNTSSFCGLPASRAVATQRASAFAWSLSQRSVNVLRIVSRVVQRLPNSVPFRSALRMKPSPSLTDRKTDARLLRSWDIAGIHQFISSQKDRSHIDPLEHFRVRFHTAIAFPTTSSYLDGVQPTRRRHVSFCIHRSVECALTGVSKSRYRFQESLNTDSALRMITSHV